MKTFSKKTSSALLLGLVLIGLGCQPAAERPLTIGMELDYPPFEMTDTAGNPTGISVEMAQVLGKSLGRTIQIENIPFDGLIPALQTGKIDLIISSMTATPERGQSIDFSEPYVKTGICLLVGKHSAIKSIDDLSRTNFTIAVKKGTTGHLYAAEHLPQATLLVLDKDAICALEVSQGKADAFIYDQISVYNHWKRNQATTRPVFEPIRAEYWAIGIRKGNDDLRQQVNAFLAQFRAKNGFEILGDQYLKDQKETFKDMGVAFLF